MIICIQNRLLGPFYTISIIVWPYLTIWWKNLKEKFLTNFVKGYFKAFREMLFSRKKYFLHFCRNFCFNIEISSYHYCRLKKHLKDDPETRSYAFLTKTRQNNPMSGFILISGITSENDLNLHINAFQYAKYMFFFRYSTTKNLEKSLKIQWKSE